MGGGRDQRRGMKVGYGQVGGEAEIRGEIWRWRKVRWVEKQGSEVRYEGGVRRQD